MRNSRCSNRSLILIQITVLPTLSERVRRLFVFLLYIFRNFLFFPFQIWLLSISRKDAFPITHLLALYAPETRGCTVILRRICHLSLTRITHQISRAFNLNLPLKHSLLIFISVLSCRNNYDISVCAPSYNSKAHPRQSFHAKKGLDHWSSPVFLRVCATS